MKTLRYAAYRDKILAGWLGKTLGGIVGYRHENHKQFSDMTLDRLWPPSVPPNDDLDLQILWLEALQEYGLDLDSADLAAIWQDRCSYNFCEYGFFLNNIQRGIMPPYSGSWNNDYFSESEGCPIRGEIWGLIAPGNPALAADYATLDAQLDHAGLSVEIERFIAATIAAAFFHDDLDTVLAIGGSVIPADSEAVRAVANVRRLCELERHPKRAWRRLIREYGDRDASKALTNHAITLMSLFLGRENFKDTMLLAVNAGWDTDCTAATAGSLLAVMHGLDYLPQDWVEKAGETLVCGIKIKHANASFMDLAEETAVLGVELALSRNDAVRITDAPDIPVRAARQRGAVAVTYPADPVLGRQGGRFRFSCAAAPDAVPTVTGPDGWRLATAPVANAPATWEVVVSPESPVTRLPDTNLFSITVKTPAGDTHAGRAGLGGARQWLVYGPYWDMWDRRQFAECPFSNAERICVPVNAGLLGDHYNHYVDLDREYVDEAALLAGELPDEAPLHVELGPDLIASEDFGHFKGQACYYLVRTICADEPVSGRLHIGRSGPCRVWLDGELLGENREMRQWAPYETPAWPVTFDRTPRRLVIKLLQLADSSRLSVVLWGAGDPTGRRGISLHPDNLADIVPSIGVARIRTDHQE